LSIIVDVGVGLQTAHVESQVWLLKLTSFAVCRAEVQPVTQVPGRSEQRSCPARDSHASDIPVKGLSNLD